MAPALKSARLVLQPFCLADIESLHRLWIEPEVRRYLWDDVIIARERVTGVVKQSLETFKSHGFGFWKLRCQQEQENDIVGFCGFRREPESGELELLCGLAPGYWGRGLATEAARTALDYAFNVLGAEEIVAGTDAPNEASVRVMDRLGMTFRRRFYRAELRWEQVYYGITREEYRKHTGSAPGSTV